MLLVFLASPLFGLPLIGRYVRTPAVLLAVFYGLAVFGWQLLPEGHRERRGWLIAGVLAALLSVAFIPWHVKQLHGLENRLDFQGAYYRDLRSVGQSGTVRSALDRCGKIATADHRPIPHLRWWTGGDPGSVAPVGTPEARGARVLLLPRRTPAMKRFYTSQFPKVKAPAGFTLIYRNASWRVVAAPACR